MKKNLLTASIAIVVLLGSCAKDKKFDDQNLGISNIEVKGVSFPQSKDLLSATTAKDTVSIAGDVNSTTALQTIAIVAIALESEFPATTDVNVSIALKPSIVPSIYVPLPAGSYSLPTSIKIPAGAKFVKIPIVFPNTSGYDLTTTFGLGLTITGVDGGYQVAKNSKDIVITFNVKNKYDGNYSLNGYHNRDPYTFPYTNIPMAMKTSGASSVKFFWIAADDFGHPIGTGPGTVSWYGNAIAPEITFDPVTNNVTSVVNTGGATPITMFTGAGSFPSRYDPSTKKIYVCWNYNNNPLRAFFDTLTYTGPR